MKIKKNWRGWTKRQYEERVKNSDENLKKNVS